MQLGVSLGIPYTLGKPAAVFSPLDLSPVLWLDASDTSTITESGGAVSQWDDKSGNANHVAQATAANQPTSGTRTINGLNVIDFDGTSDVLRTASADVLSQPFTIFGVVHVDAGLQFLDSQSSSNRVVWLFNANTFMTLNAGANLQPGGLSYFAADHIFTAVVNGSSSSLAIDASTITTGNAGSNSFGLVTVGASYANSQFINAGIGEIAIVPTIDSGDIDAMHSYLADKWGITL